MVDSNGNTVKNYNGTILLDTNSGSTTLNQNGVALTPTTGNTYKVNVKNGVASVDAISTSTASSDTFNASGLSGESGINYGNTSVSLTQPSSAGISLTPTMKDVSNNSSSNSDPVQVNYLDQAGKTYTVSVK